MQICSMYLVLVMYFWKKQLTSCTDQHAWIYQQSTSDELEISYDFFSAHFSRHVLPGDWHPARFLPAPWLTKAGSIIRLIPEPRMAGKMFMASFTYKISWWVGATLDHRLALSSPVRADSAESCAVSLRHTGSVRADCWLQNTLQNPMRNEHIFDATNQLIASGY